MRSLKTKIFARTAVSIFLAGVILLVLVLTAPQSAEAVTVTLTPSTTLAGIGANITFDVSVVIASDERIPIQDVSLRLFSDPGCSNELTAAPYSSPRDMSLYQAIPGTGYGYGMLYGNDTREGQPYYFGYGYGYGGNVTHVYRCVVDTHGWSATSYYSRGDVNCGTHTFESGVSSFRLTSIVAETAIVPIERLNDKIVIIPITILRIKDATTGETVTGVNVASYQARALYDPAGITMLDVLPGDAPFNNPVVQINNAGGYTTFRQSAPPGIEPPATVAYLVPRLVGCATDEYDLAVGFDFITDQFGNQIPHELPQHLGFQRGDVNKDGQVTMADYTAGEDFLAGRIPAESVNLLNLASVHHDQAYGDRCKNTDTRDIRWYLDGRLNCYFQ